MHKVYINMMHKVPCASSLVSHDRQSILQMHTLEYIEGRCTGYSHDRQRPIEGRCTRYPSSLDETMKRPSMELGHSL